MISLYLSYHGGTFGAMAASGGAKRKVKFEPHMPGFLKAFSPIQLRDRFPSWEETNRFCARLFEEIIVNENPETVAAVLIEPICNTGGIVTPTEEYFPILARDLRAPQRAADLRRGADRLRQDRRHVRGADLRRDAGHPLLRQGAIRGVIPSGAIMVREDLAEAFYGRPEDEIHFVHGHTFAGNPLAAAAGIAVIDEIVEKKLPQKARRLGEHLRRRLEGLKHVGVVREVRGRASCWGWSWCKTR